jgi:hypothetical protein
VSTVSRWPKGVTGFLLSPMTQPMYFIQGPKEVVMILTSFNEVRHVHLTDKHSANVKTSWYGESIGHYEGDTLVVDTMPQGSPYANPGQTEFSKRQMF